MADNSTLRDSPNITYNASNVFCNLFTQPRILNPQQMSSNVSNTRDNIISVFMISVYSIICIFGFFGNFVVVTIVLRCKKMQTATNWLLFNLAISHLAIIIIVIPLWIIIPQVSWPFGDIGCKYLVMPVMEHLAGVCVLTHTAVGVARYFVVKNTRHCISNLQVKATVASIWIIAFLFLSVPLMGVLGEFELKRNTQKHSCRLEWRNNKTRYVYRIMTFILTYIIPMVASGISYIKIHNIVSQRLKCLGGTVSLETFSIRQKQTRHMNKILATMYVLFAITTLPLQLLFFLHDFNAIPKKVWKTEIINVLFILFYTQVIINPIVLFYTGEHYRKEILKLTLCCCYIAKTKMLLIGKGKVKATVGKKQIKKTAFTENLHLPVDETDMHNQHIFHTILRKISTEQRDIMLKNVEDEEMINDTNDNETMKQCQNTQLL